MIFSKTPDIIRSNYDRKVKSSLYLSKYHALKTYEGEKVQLHAFLTLEIDGGEWSASRLGRFTPCTQAKIRE
jgi:hypothetical protein